MPINMALTRTEAGVTSDNEICPCANRQKTHGWPGVARPKSWDCRCAELTASTEEKSNRKANQPASADFATNAQVFCFSFNRFPRKQTGCLGARFILRGGAARARDRILLGRQSTGLSILRSLRCLLSAFPGAGGRRIPTEANKGNEEFAQGQKGERGSIGRGINEYMRFLDTFSPNAQKSPLCEDFCHPPPLTTALWR